MEQGDAVHGHLLVVDNDSDRSNVVNALKEWSVDEASTIADAIAQMLTEVPDVIVAGASLPELGALADAVYVNLRTRHVPILIVGSHETREVRGVDDYISLDAKPHELAARLKTLAELSRLRASCYRDQHVLLTQAGHELVAPLAALHAAMQALARRQPSHETDSLRRSTEHMVKHVSNLLDLSRLGGGMVTLQHRVVELASVLDRALEIIASDVGARAFAVNVPSTGFLLEADFERLAAVFALALANAVKYSDASTTVTVHATTVGGRVRVGINDRGVGIAPERLPAMLESFRTPTAGTLHLGLAIARELVELHGGTIEVNSAGVGHGTEVTIELPLTEREVEITEPTVPRKRLLVIEDHDDTARALKTALEQLGYAVAVAHDAPVALVVAKAFDPDVALVDLNLPVLDGWELARRLRARNESIQFVAVTAYGQDADLQRSRDIGFVDHLVKPIDLAKLDLILDRLPSASR